MTLRKTSRLFTAAALAALAGCEEVGPDEVWDPEVTSEALLGGTLDATHRFAVGLCTGALLPDGSCPPAGTPGTIRCSGTLITRDLVLTARHCVEDFGPPATADFCSAAFNGVQINPAMQITPNDSVFQAGATWYPVAAVHTPPGDNLCEDDLVILELAGAVQGVKPAGVDLYRNLAHFLPAQVAIVGRGAIVERFDPATGARVEFDNGGALRRRQEHIPFLCASDVDGGCAVTDFFSDPPVFSLPAGLFAYGRSGASGDSGAGVFAQGFFDFELFLAIGVNTLGTINEDGEANSSQGVRLSRHAGFIRSVVKAAAAAGRYPVPLWAR